MGLKGYRLWAMGQLDSTCRAPPLSALMNTGNKPGGVRPPEPRALMTSKTFCVIAPHFAFPVRLLSVARS
jgi:hypothetical protein